jgi:hypothetical protein
MRRMRAMSNAQSMRPHRGSREQARDAEGQEPEQHAVAAGTSGRFFTTRSQAQCTKSSNRKTSAGLQ